MVAGFLAYLTLVVMLRITGKRTLSKLNAFDLVVTVALGSTLATILLSKDVPLIEGITAFFTLIILQFAVTWSSVRSKHIRNLVKAEPKLLYCGGDYLENAMREERVTRDEVKAAVRQQGFADLGAINTVILETDGSMSVIPEAQA